MILSNSDYISVRDDLSKICGLNANNSVAINIVPDAVLSLDRKYFGLSSLGTKKPTQHRKVTRLAINLCRNISKPEVWSNFLDEIIKFLILVNRQNPGIQIIGIPMQTNYTTDDQKVLEELKNKFVSSKISNNFKIEKTKGAKELVDLLGTCDLVITERLHCAILSTILAIPFISLEYDIKVKGYLQSINMIDCGIAIDEKFNSSALYQKTVFLMNNYHAHQKCLEKLFQQKNYESNRYFEFIRNLIIQYSIK